MKVLRTQVRETLVPKQQFFLRTVQVVIIRIEDVGIQRGFVGDSVRLFTTRTLGFWRIQNVSDGFSFVVRVRNRGDKREIASGVQNRAKDGAVGHLEGKIRSIPTVIVARAVHSVELTILLGGY